WPARRRALDRLDGGPCIGRDPRLDRARVDTCAALAHARIAAVGVLAAPDRARLCAAAPGRSDGRDGHRPETYYHARHPSRLSEPTPSADHSRIVQQA